MKRKHILLIPIIILLITSIYYLPTDLKVKQFIWFIIGIILYFIVSNMKFSKIIKYSNLFYLIGIGLLIIVLLLNKFTNGSRGWITISFVSFQPSEIMKIFLILFTIKYFKKLKTVSLILIYLIPMILIFLEPDTGGVIQEFIILLYFLIKKIDKKQLIKYGLFSLLLISVFVTLYIFNKDILINIFGTSLFYRIDRISSFIRDDNLQTTNAIISIATGNTLYFPEMYNDFYISYILSKNIFMLMPIIISTVVLLIIINNKNTLVAQVSFYLIFWQCFHNLAMNLKIVPVIGIPYLFISYGGSSLITTILLIALINSKDDIHSKNYKALDMD